MKRENFLVTALSLFPVLVFQNKFQSIQHITKGFKVRAGKARFGMSYKMKGVTLNTLDVKISGRDTGGKLVVFEQTGLTPKGGPPLHIHLYQDEWFYIIDGQYEFQVGDDRFHMESGDTIFLPRNIQHAFIQLSKTAKVLVSFMPAGKMESFFAMTDKWEAPPDKEEVKKVFSDHEMQVVGAPLKY